MEKVPLACSAFLCGGAYPVSDCIGLVLIQYVLADALLEELRMSLRAIFVFSPHADAAGQSGRIESRF